MISDKIVSHWYLVGVAQCILSIARRLRYAGMEVRLDAGDY